MRSSSCKNTLAVLRVILGIKQQHFADLIGINLHTLQSIETNRMKLSEKLASSVCQKTGVSMEWLLKNDAKAPIVDAYGATFDKARYEAFCAVQLLGEHPDFKRMNILRIFRANLYRLEALCLRAYKNNNLSLCAYGLSKSLGELEKAFGVNEDDDIDIGPSAPALNNEEFRKIGEETASSFQPLLVQFFASACALNTKENSQEVREKIWNAVKKGTEGFFVEGLLQSDGQTDVKLHKLTAHSEEKLKVNPSNILFRQGPTKSPKRSPKSKK